MAEAVPDRAENYSARPRPVPMRIACFFTAILIYALWGTPTPENPGPVEILTGSLLIISAGVGGAYYALDFARGGTWQLSARLLLFYGLTVPLITGLALGNDITAMARDMIPFVFLLLPLFIAPLFRGRADQVRILTCMIVLGGWLFSARVLLPYVLETPVITDPFRLANAPTVLFAGMFLLGMCGLSLYRALPPPYALKSALFFALALVPVVTMALITQRASMGVAGMMAFSLLMTGFIKRPLRVVVPLCLLLAAVVAYWPFITDLAQSLMRKTALVGFNMRWQEALAVFGEISGSFFTVIFGKGWGAQVASPAVGGDVVNFTHSLLTTYWLKTGLAGLSFVLFYLYRLGLLLWRLLFRNPVMAMALGGPFLIDIFLYASFKSLDYGLVLLLIVLWAKESDSLHKRSGYSIEE